MRRLYSLAYRSTPSLQNLTKNPQNTNVLYHSQFKNNTPASPSPSSSRGNSPINHHYVSLIISRNDWFFLLNHELKAKRVTLNSQFVVSLLQNQENPLYALRFYIWVSNIDPLFSKNQSVKGVLATVLYKKGPVLLSVELVKDLRISGLSVTEDLLSILICSWGRLGLAKYCSEIFGQISFLGISPSTRLYNAVIDALIKSNSLDLAYLKFQQMSADNCKPDRFTYNILIHGICRIGVMDEALRLVKQMESLGYLPNVYTYTILIDGFCNARRVDDAFRLVETMKKRNVLPNEATVRSLIHGVFRCVTPHRAFELLILFLEKEPMMQKLVCDTLLFCLSNNYMAREAALFMKKLSGRGYMPDNSTFNLTMTCLIKGFNLDETCQILDSFIERGLKLGFNTYLALIQALYSVGHCAEGDWYLDQMTKDGLLSTVFSYNVLIDCFCKASMMDRARKTFREMCLRGIAPTLVTYNTLIGGHCKIGQVHEAREFLVMLLESGFHPDIFTFSSLIDGLCRAHMIEDAFDCFAEMFQWDVTPNDVTYNILIRSLCVIGDVARAMKLVRKMQATGISPDIFSFNALIQSFCRMKKIEKAEKLFVTMLTLGLDPDNYTYGAFIKALCESERFDEAIGMFHSMEAKGCIPDSYICNLVSESLVQKGCLEEARGSVIKHLTVAFHTNFSTPVELLLAECNRTSGKTDEVLPQTGAIAGDPAQIVAKALLCFSDKNIYISCEESCRLTASGNLEVPLDYTDKYCSGPCLSETHLVLNCIDNVMTNFLFYNKATIQDIKDTIQAGCGYGPERVQRTPGNSIKDGVYVIKGLSSCDIFNGNWVLDDSDPVYLPGSCPDIDDSFNRFKIGRVDFSYVGYRWKPFDCQIPRNMWESLVCALRESLKDKRRIFEVSGRSEFRAQGFYSFRIRGDYKCSTDFIKSPFLVEEWKISDKSGIGRETLRLDMIQGSKHRDADIIVFNTAKVTSRKAAMAITNWKQKKRLQRHRGHGHNGLMLTLIETALGSSLGILSFSFQGSGQWDTDGHCHGETEPMANETSLAPYPWMMSILESIIAEMKTPVFYLNITKMTAYRKDGHHSIYRPQRS
ncbi:hypothetical protein CRYUN_Cryun10bG0010300 [Craigia yunnanensis]